MSAARRAFFGQVLLALLLVLPAARAHADGGLAGQVQSAWGRPLAGVEVTVRDPDQRLQRTARSDQEGRYRFDDLPQSTYRLYASLPGYRMAELDEVFVLDGQVTDLPISLSASMSEDVVVTGELLENTRQETPGSVAVHSAESMQDAGMRELLDVYNQSANVYQIANGEGFGIRGINHNSVGTGGAGELAGYSIDGTWQTGFSKRYGPVDLWDVEQVEILRGPQTTNVGRNALAGSVIVNTADPKLRNESAFRLGAGNFETYELAGMVNAAIGDSAAVRFTAEHRETEGFVYNPTRDEDDYDAREFLTLRGKYLYQPADRDDFRFVMTAQYAETERGNDAVDLADISARQNTSNLDDFEVADNLSVNGKIEWEINDRWSLRSVTSYLRSDYDRFDDDDQSPIGDTGFRGRNAVDKNWAQDLRFEYDNGTLRGVSGLFYTNVKLDNDTAGETRLRLADFVTTNPEIAPLLPLYPDPIVAAGDLLGVFDTDNLGLFTRWEWDVSDRWMLFWGLRYDDEDQSSNSSNVTRLISELPNPADFPAPISAGITAVNALLLSNVGTSSSATDTSYEAFLPEIGVSVQLKEDVTLSAFYKRGYRAGGAELSLVGRQNDYDPEYLDNFELALRSQALDQRLTVNANMYFGSWDDQQVDVQQSGSSFDFLTENVGESEIYGAELEIDYQPLDTWNWYFTLGFAHTEFTEFVSRAGEDLGGNRFSGAPEWTAATGFSYRHPNGLFLHGDVNYQGSSYANVQNDILLDSRTLLNLRAGYETERYSVLLGAYNLTDEEYAVTGFDNVDGRSLGKTGAPRRFLVEFGMRF
ncbi:MAG: TonB-dependent receptor [Acidobacteriota bacterium]